MRLAATLIAVLSVATPTLADGLTPRARLVEAFVRGLTRDDTTEIVALAGETDLIDFSHFEDLDSLECISVRGYQFAAETADTIRVDLDASGLTRGAAHRQVALPSSWILEVDCDEERCILRRAETLETRAARLLLDAPPAEWSEEEICPDLDSKAMAWWLARQFTEVTSRQGNFMKADVAPFTVALQLARQSGDRALESRVLSQAASTAGARVKIRLALELGHATVAAAEASRDMDAIAGARFRLGLLQWGGGQSEQACRTLESAAALIDALDDAGIALKSLFMAAYIHRLRGELRDFLLECERVIELARRYHWMDVAAVASMAIGELHLSTRDYALARDDFRAAYGYASAPLHKAHSAYALSDLGVTQMNMGDLAAAAESMHQAEKLGRSFAGGTAGVEMQLSIGLFLMRSGRLAEAEEHLLAARETTKRIAVTRCTVDAATAVSQLRLLQKRPAEALLDAQDALNIDAQTPLTIDSSTWRALLAKAGALRALGRGEEAMDALRAAIDAVEVQSGAAPADAVAAARFFEDKVGPYTELIQLLVDRGRPAEAFDTAERMKAHALRDVLARGNVDSNAILTAAERDEERRLTEELAALNKTALTHTGDRKSPADIRARIAAARLALERFEARVEIAHPAAPISRVFAHRGSRRFPRELRNGVAVEFVVGEHRTIVFAASADGVVARSIRIGRGELERRVERLAQQIERRDLAWSGTAARLHDLLLAPVGDRLRARKLICIIPDDVLWRVPFHLLRHDGRDLLDRAAVFYAPSLSMFGVAPRHERDGARGALIAFGNPAVVHQTHDRLRALTRDAALGSLPDAESEVRAIASLYRPDESRVYLREAARESVFKREAPRYRIVHLAAHGILDDRSPMYSAIVLAATPDEADDGLLEAREILSLHVGAQLAVLASCDTARGRIGAGEGVIGISWAFLVGGCPTTVVSQWKADSKATEALMVEFHRRLRAGESPAAALRHAQLAVRANPRYQDPLYWAPFIVVGAGMRSVL